MYIYIVSINEGIPPVIIHFIPCHEMCIPCHLRVFHEINHPAFGLPSF